MKMKLFASIFVTCTLFLRALSLRCFSCKDPTGNCTEEQACNSTQNLSCRTILGTLNSFFSSDESVIYECGSCIGNLSLNLGTLSASTTESCCQSDLCNNQNITEEANTTLNGLKCFMCSLFDTCENPATMVKCMGSQTRCLHSSVTVNSFPMTVKGCASETTCQNPEVLKDYGVQTQQDFYCCRGSGCNRGSSDISSVQITTPLNIVTANNYTSPVLSLPVNITNTAAVNDSTSTVRMAAATPTNLVTNSPLRCFACEDETGVCTDQHACDPAENLHCRTILGKLTIGRITQTSVVRDCGACIGNLSFDGGTFSASTIESCCQTDLCNNRTITEEANTTLNGLQCYVCPSILSRTCDNPLEMVKCAGTQTRCLHSSIRYSGQHNVTIKGCASERMCALSDLPKVYGITLGPDFFCCAENGCNGERTVVEQSTVQSTTNGKPALRPRVALLAAPLLAAAMRLLPP
ncbi:uncharacterized protein LOC125448407 [Stegostoma tigrinum]|uniref:uncharacterized protein LOC125448407 n=1 Tax=Stegostoma tigrinum TaxID=3053191 RepID=UPI0028702171|nr:uncharacterized protein LOC125448407 [Stegostoma tigrinum]